MGESKLNPVLKYGLAATAAVIVLNLILHFTVGAQSVTGQALTNLNYLIYGAALFMALAEIKKSQGGYITFGKAFGKGMQLMLLATVLIVGYRYMYDTVINPKAAQERVDMVNAKLDEAKAKPGVQEEQVNTIEKIFSKAMEPGPYALIGFFGLIITSLIFSLIVALIVKKDPPFLPKQDQPNAHIAGDFDPYR